MWSPRNLTLGGCAQLGKGLIKSLPGRELKKFPGLGTQPLHGVRALLLSEMLFIYRLCRAACEILAPQPGTERRPPALEAWSPNYWTAREVPPFEFLAFF